MNLAHYLLLFLQLSALASAAKNASRTNMRLVPIVGCNLIIPEHVNKQMEANGKPLAILIDFEVFGVRDVPDSGGSYAMDVK